MAQQKNGAAGVTAREIDNSIVTTQEPSGVPAGVIGTSLKGPAFVPLTLGNTSEFYARFGKTDGKKFGPLAVSEWLRYSTSATFLRVLGVGDGSRRLRDGVLAGSVNGAGFVVGEQQPDDTQDGIIVANPSANSGGNPGRTYFLGAFMSESLGSTLLSSAGFQASAAAVPVIRGVLMAASGVVARLSTGPVGPTSTTVGTDAAAVGGLVGNVTLSKGSSPRQEFALVLNGHKGTDPLYPNVLTASFDLTSPNYFANVFNTDPYKLQSAGHYLYAHYDVHPVLATVTGSGIVYPVSGSGATGTGVETAAFITSGSLARNVGSALVPNYENFADRYSHAKSPWVTSQRFGATGLDLFRLHALDAGAGVSTLYKVSVENIVKSGDPSNPYPGFDVIIRNWNDRDAQVSILEQWRGLTLDPSSERYICRVIGDMYVYFDFDRSDAAQKLVFDGNYPNASAYVRVEINPDIEAGNIDPAAYPMGYRGVPHLVTSGSSPLASVGGPSIAGAGVLKGAVQPPVPFRQNITAGTGAKVSANPQLYWGAQFEHVASVDLPNGSTLRNDGLKSFARAFPDHMTNSINVVVSDNEGALDTPELGILDADRFGNNAFSLERIQVVTGSQGYADPAAWASAQYVRKGNIVPNDGAKTRGVTVDDFTTSNRRFLKYTLFMAGGQDGVNIFNKNEAELSNFAVNADSEITARGLINGPAVKAYTKALDIMGNTVNTDLKLLAIPGIRNELVTSYALDTVQDRFDALYIMDIEQYDINDVRVTSDSQTPSVDYTAQAFEDRALDSSFAAAYFPDVVMRDPNTGTNVVAPPSVAVLGAMALNDSVAHPWFAPAGFTRGALATTLEARVRLSKGNLDVLANSNINPLTAFPGNSGSGINPKGGVVVWGQKTLQASASSLDRVNVRRLLIELRRQVRDVVQNTIFEPNRDATLAAISAAVTPRLRRVQALAGIERFKVVFDASTTSQADILANTVRGVIVVQPTKVIEQVRLDFVVTNQGATIS